MESRLRQALEAAPERSAPSAAAHAATAVILSGHDCRILFIQRAERKGDPWSNQMALPGGRKDPEDVNLAHTARRETWEEVGVRLEDAELWGPLPAVRASPRNRVATVPTHGELWVTPFVFRWTQAEPPLKLDQREVQDAVWIPAQELLAESAQTRVSLPRGDGRWELPAWRIGGRVIWGLTYFMVLSLLDPGKGAELRVPGA